MKYIYVLSALPVIFGLLSEEPTFIASASMLVGFGYAAIEVMHAREGRMSALMLMAFFCGIAGTADLVGYFCNGTKWERDFFIYVNPDYLLKAQTLWYVGTLAMIGGYTWMSRRDAAWWRSLPQIGARIRLDRLPHWIAVVAFCCTALLSRGVDFGGSAFGDAFRMAPSMAAFYLARLGTESRVNRVLFLGVLVALFDSTRAVLYLYMRFAMVFPFLAVALGVLTGSRSFRRLWSPTLIPIVLAIAIMAPYTGVFATARQNLPTGPERIIQLTAMRAEASSGWIATLARFTTYNQTTQVMSLADREGFLMGETLSYLTYAFIPRAIWPSKPVIAQGQWFAQKLGLGSFLSGSTGFSNSINMTLPGELYLNFGWPGVVVGCFVVGGFVSVLWRLCGFWARGTDLLSTLFGFRLLWGAWVLLNDIQNVVTLTAYYVLFVAIGWALRHLKVASRTFPSGEKRIGAEA
ncbi:MAG: hypothetical protein C4576_31295 [Desulfobacteraceae bacterium]|nr:MAG: hypothetical protein C4576_31295 [Desulfobacteraceae bacterium]